MRMATCPSCCVIKTEKVCLALPLLAHFLDWNSLLLQYVFEDWSSSKTTKPSEGLNPKFKSDTHTFLVQFLKGHCSLFIPNAPPVDSLLTHSHNSKTEREMSSRAGATASRAGCPMTAGSEQHAGIWCGCLLLGVRPWGFRGNGSQFLESVGLSLQGLWTGRRAVEVHVV